MLRPIARAVPASTAMTETSNLRNDMEITLATHLAHSPYGGQREQPDDCMMQLHDAVA